MYLDQTVKITRTIVPHLNLLILELIFMRKQKTRSRIKMDMLLKVQSFQTVKSENGPPSIGKVISKVVLSSLIPDKKLMVFQRHLLLDHQKYSSAGNLLSHNSDKVIKLRSVVHLTTFGEVLILQHHLVENQFLFTLISSLILKLLNAIELQNSLNKLNNQSQQLFNQNNASTSISTNPKELHMTLFSQLMMKSGDGGGQPSMLKLNTKSLMIQVKCGFKMKMVHSAMLPIQLSSLM